MIDNDIVDLTNINRQLIADKITVGKAKVEVARERYLNINPQANITIYKEFLNPSNISELISSEYNYIVDAIDTVPSKILLIQKAVQNNINIISCMGTGNKLDTTKFKIADIYSTSVCPLAKKIRKSLSKLEVPKLKVLYSTEEPIKNATNTPASISYVPAVAGLMIAEEVIKSIISQNESEVN